MTVAPARRRRATACRTGATRVEVDTLAVGWGFIPQLELPLALGLRHRAPARTAARSSAVDDDQQTSVPGCSSRARRAASAAPELARGRGRIAGVARRGDHPAGDPGPAGQAPGVACGDSPPRWHEAYPVPAAWQHGCTDETLVCRCEEVTVGTCARPSKRDRRHRRADGEAAGPPRHGLVPGPRCAATPRSCLTAAWAGAEPTFDAGTRPIAQPVPLGLVASGLAGGPSVRCTIALTVTPASSPSSPKRGTSDESSPVDRTAASTARSVERKPWHGVLVATALPFHDDLSVDFDAYAEHVAWLAANGCDGVAPNGSLGEYQTLTAEERAAVVETAVEAAPDGFTVMPGVAAYGALEARRWAEQAAEAGAPAVMLLPPNAYRADERAVVEHYREVAKAGLPIVGLQQPDRHQGRPDPELLAKLHGRGPDRRRSRSSPATSGGPTRSPSWRPASTSLDRLRRRRCSSSPWPAPSGWVAGYPNALPRSLRRAVPGGRGRRPGHRAAALPGAAPAAALGLQDRVRPGDQAVDGPGRAARAAPAGRRGSRCCPSRSAAVREATEHALAAGWR